MDYIDRERFSYESGETEADKTYMVVCQKEEAYYTTAHRDSAEDMFRTIKERQPDKEWEFGFIYSHDFCADFEYMYNLFNPIKL